MFDIIHLRVDIRVRSVFLRELPPHRDQSPRHRETQCPAISRHRSATSATTREEAPSGASVAVEATSSGPGEKMSATNIIKSLQVKDAEPRGMRYSVGPAGGVELVEDLTDVEFGGMDRNVEPPSDLLVGGALGKQC